MSKIDNEIKEGTPRFKKGDAFVEMAPRHLVFMEVNEVKVSQSYINENGGKDGGNVVENVVENITDVPSLSQALSQVDKRWQATSSSKVATSDEKVASPTFPIIHGSDTNRSNGVARSFRCRSKVVART